MVSCHYQFLWSNGATSEDISNLTAGEYSVSVIDANNDNITDSLTITEPSGLLPGGGVGIIVFASNRDGQNEIYTMNADGSNQTQLTNNPAMDWLPDWSPDGSKIVFSSDRDGTNDIFIMDSDGGNATKIECNTSDQELYPAWSPDGTRILFTRGNNNFSEWELFIYDISANNVRQLTNNQIIDDNGSWSSDGSKILFTAGPSFNFYEIYEMDADGSNVVRLTNNSVPETFASWSPDGSLIAFGSEGNMEDIFLMNSDGSNRRSIVSRSGNDFNSCWSPDGNYLAFQTTYGNNDDEIAIIEIATSIITRITFSPGWDSNPDWK